MKNNFKFLETWLNNFERQKDSIAEKVGDTALNYFIDQFNKQQWRDKTVVKWTSLKESTLKYKERKGYGNTPLVNTGDLKEALKNSKVASSWNRGIIFKINIDYASYHNDGGEIDGRPPQRQFIGNSYELNKKIKKVIKHELKRIFK